MKVQNQHQINPENQSCQTSVSGWFSPNLMKFLKKHKHFRQIFLDPTDKIWYIGYKDENGIWAGAKFLRVLCLGTKSETFSYSKSVTDNFIERTNQFWNCSEYFGRRMFKRWYW